MKTRRARIYLAGVAALGAAALFVNAGAQGDKVGKAAPDFTAKTHDGQTHSLKSLTEKGPLFLYFIKDGCPINHRMVRYYNELGKAYKGKATLVGVIDGDAAVAKAWQNQYKPTFPVVMDPDLKIIKGYGAQFSPWSLMVEDGKIAKVWQGASLPALKEMNTAMAKAGKINAAAINLEGAPASLSGG